MKIDNLTELAKAKLDKLPKWAREYVKELQIDSQTICYSRHKPPLSGKEIETLLSLTGRDVIVGYYFNEYNGKVTRGCSSNIGHSRINHLSTNSQRSGAGIMFDSELDASIACKNLMIKKFKRELFSISNRITELENDRFLFE